MPLELGLPEAPTLSSDGRRSVLSFRSYDIEAYRTFLAAKRIPEREVSYDWRNDTYHLAFPPRFASVLGGSPPPSVIGDGGLAPFLFDYQSFFVGQALEARRYAMYWDCGLGKTPAQWEFLRQAEMATRERCLVFAPLNVIHQHLAEVDRFYSGNLRVRPLKSRGELEAWLDGDGDIPFGIVNFEKLDEGPLPQLKRLGGISIDESSMLKSGGGKRKWNLIHSCKGIEFKLSCTATPAPNEAMEYASQAAFLEKLRSEGEILWTFFTRRDGGDWEVKPHAREAFFRFMSSWSIYLRSPAAYGFADNLADLPDPVWLPLEVTATDDQMSYAHRIFCEHGAGLFGDEGLGIVPRTKLMQAARGFLYRKDEGGAYDRIDSRKPAIVGEIVRDELKRGNRTLVWTAFDAEADLIAEHLPAGSFEVLDGRTKPKDRPAILARTESGDTPVLIAKPSTLGFGMNLQWFTAMVFAGFDDSYERMYQAVRRAYRYGQTAAVRVHVPYVPELEGMVWQNLQEKGRRFEQEATEMERCYRAALGLGVRK